MDYTSNYWKKPDTNFIKGPVNCASKPVKLVAGDSEDETIISNLSAGNRPFQPWGVQQCATGFQMATGALSFRLYITESFGSGFTCADCHTTGMSYVVDLQQTESDI